MLQNPVKATESARIGSLQALPVPNSFAMDDNKTIKLGDLITEQEIMDIREYVRDKRSIPNPPTVYNCIMRWLDMNKPVLERFRKHGILKAYGAYAFEYYLGIS